MNAITTSTFALCLLLTGCTTPERYGDLPQARMVVEQPNRFCLFWCHITLEQTTVMAPGATGGVTTSGGAIQEVEQKQTVDVDGGAPVPVVAPLSAPTAPVEAPAPPK